MKWLAVFTLLFLNLSAQAAGGKLRHLEFNGLASNWRVEQPKVVFAFGYFEKPLAERYAKYARGEFQSKLKDISPMLSVEVIERARGEDVVDALKDKNTVGLIFISHTFQTRTSKVSVALTADGYPLPMDILSAATPALRFAGFFGCHGQGIPKEYEVEYEFERLPGHHDFYFNEDKLLSANFFFIDDLKTLLKKDLKALQEFGPSGFTDGVKNDTEEEGTLRIQVKDVVSAIEPRYVYVNDRIVGVLGGNQKYANHDLGYEEFVFNIPALALKTKRNCSLVKISSSQLTPGALVDDYLINFVSVNGPESAWEKDYSPAWHLGESSGPLPEIGPMPPLHGSKKEKAAQQREYLINATKAYTWMDRDSGTWNASPLHGRFFIDCI